MPELHHNFAALVMHRFGDMLPAVKLLGAIQAGHIGIALALVADGGGFGNQQPGRGALGIVLSHQGCGNGVRRAVARQWRHHDAVGKLPIANLNSVE